MGFGIAFDNVMQNFTHKRKSSDSWIFPLKLFLEISILRFSFTCANSIPLAFAKIAGFYECASVMFLVDHEGRVFL